MLEHVREPGGGAVLLEAEYMKIKLLALLAVFMLLLLSGCQTQEKELSQDEKMDILYDILDGSNTDIFVCYNCGELAVTCTCHTEYGYLGDYCCKCARLNFAICKICGNAAPVDEVQNLDGNLFCTDCMKKHGEDNPVLVDGELVYFG